MQVQVKPRLYSDVNKKMDESYYNYEAFEIEYGYAILLRLEISIIFKSLRK